MKAVRLGRFLGIVSPYDTPAPNGTARSEQMFPKRGDWALFLRGVSTLESSYASSHPIPRE